MSRMSLLFTCLAVAGLILVGGCSPTVLGDKSMTGERSKTLLGGDARYDMLRTLSFKAESNGESLSITVMTKTGGSCKADFRLTEMVSSYPLVPFMPHDPQLVYEGEWQQNLSSECLEIVQAPGGTRVTAKVAEPDDDERGMVLCTDDTTGLCTNNIPVTFKAGM